MSIIITIISTITVLLSHNVISFGYFVPRSHGVSKKAPKFVSLPPLSPNQVFTRFVCCFTRNTLLIFSLLWSNRLLQKIMHFQSKTIFFFQPISGRFWFCCFVYMCFLGHFYTANSFMFAYMYSFVGPSSNHMA